MQVNSIHGEFLGIFQKQHVCLGWNHWPGKTQIRKVFSKICFIVSVICKSHQIIYFNSYINTEYGEALHSLSLLNCAWLNHVLTTDCHHYVAPINAHPLWLPVCAVQLHHLFLQLFALSRGQAQILNIVCSMELGVILPKLWLGCVGAQQGQCDKGTWENSTHNVLPQLETKKVPKEDGKGKKLSVILALSKVEKILLPAPLKRTN